MTACGMTVEQEDGRRAPCLADQGHEGDHKSRYDCEQCERPAGVQLVRANGDVRGRACVVHEIDLLGSLRRGEHTEPIRQGAA